MSNLLIEQDLEDIIFSTLFVAGEGVDISFIAEKLDVDIKLIKKAVDKLENKLSEKSGVHLIKYNNKIQLSSNPEYADFISLILNPIREKALTRATLETLSIIAYKQPITRLEVEEVRGVNSDYTIQFLLDNKMIEVVGKKDAVGKPLLFGTTEEFLKRFGLEDLTELPNNEQLLERIKTIYTEEEKSNSLFNFKLVEEEIIEEKPEQEKEEGLSIDEIDAKIKRALENIKTKTPKEEELAEMLKTSSNVNETPFADAE
ncbi:MAG: SMC-Scp complex subunit ScpB [Clostridia bacterium]|nr:SMC-Scp complex subunit ScpB [Clostridia bacterium]